MGTLSNHKNHDGVNITDQSDQVAVIMVPFPAQGHLNQLLQLSCLISSYGLPIHYVGSVLSNRQAKTRANGLNPDEVAKIHFHDIPTPAFDSPTPNPNSSTKFPEHLQPAWEAMVNLRKPIASYLQEVSKTSRRVIVVHDPMMALMVQDVSTIHNAESYALNCISAFSQTFFICAGLGKPFPIELQKELPTFEDMIPEKALAFVSSMAKPSSCRAGDLYNTCRLIEGPCMDLLETEEITGNRKSWAIGPMLPAILTSNRQHRCLEWLDQHEPNSVIYVSFGTTTTLSDDEIQELALGLELSKVKFLWVLRDADKGDVFDGKVRRAELPGGFEERVKGVGMVMRDWAPQPEILAHSSIGGFMSHCGWNSCIESITMGVPIAAWPMHSDQPSNTILITEIFKTGLVVREWTQRREVVKASTIQNVVERLMVAEEGDEIRKSAEELAAIVRQATQEGGASRLELDSFIAHITR